jgi:glycosyltransferase involved in cell wall biosynthesis
VYTPHGGSLHYGWLSPVGFLYLAAERLLMARTDLVLCESRYAQATLRAKVGTARALCRVVHNGLTRAEFAAAAPAPDATDLLFVGELRTLKGLDVLIAALARIARQGRQASATIVGEGPDRDALHAQVRESKLDAAIQFTGALPAREAFARGRLLVVPSRAESLPYIVLEAAAAGVPMIATDVGGIPEIFGADAANLVPPGDADALACAILAAWAEPARVRALTERLRQRVATHFSADAMTDAVLAAYRDAIAARQGLTNDESRRAPIVPEQGLGSATLPDIAPEQVGISPPQPSFEAPRATLTRPPASE